VSGEDATLTRVTEGGQVRLPYDEVLVLAGLVEEACHRALREATRTAAVAASPDLLCSAPLAPLSAAAAEAALVRLGEALTGWSGSMMLDARAMRYAVRALGQADEAARAGLVTFESLLARLYGRESVPPQVRASDLQVAASGTPPSDLPALITHLAQVNDLSDGDHPENDGTVEVQTVTGPDGSRRHIAYLPGLDDMLPVSIDGDVRDAGTAVSLQAGVPTAYGTGVVQALHDAGVAPGEPVLLVGHSQGGMQAAALAAQGTPYHVTHVVTAGSPVVPGHVPAGVHVLSLEHLGDPIPLLDAGAEDASPTHVTVTFDDALDVDPLDNHALPHYVAGAQAVQHSSDPVVQHAVADLEPFLAQPGDQATGTVFQITRGDGVPHSPAWAAMVAVNPAGTTALGLR
jgi:hypothetical protein